MKLTAVIAIGLMIRLIGMAQGQQPGPDTHPIGNPNSVPDETFRTWTEASGKYRTDAKFLELKDGQVFLQKKEGNQLKVPLERLTKADQEYAHARHKFTLNKQPEPETSLEAVSKLPSQLLAKFTSSDLNAAVFVTPAQQRQLAEWEWNTANGTNAAP